MQANRQMGTQRTWKRTGLWLTVGGELLCDWLSAPAVIRWAVPQTTSPPAAQPDEGARSVTGHPHGATSPYRSVNGQTTNATEQSVTVNTGCAILAEFSVSRSEQVTRHGHDDIAAQEGTSIFVHPDLIVTVSVDGGLWRVRPVLSGSTTASMQLDQIGFFDRPNTSTRSPRRSPARTPT